MKMPENFLNCKLSFWKNTRWIPIAVILTAGFLLRLPQLNSSLWFDELWSTSMRLGGLSALARTVVTDNHPPFFSVFIFLWARLFGESEISLRLPSLIFGVSSIFLVYAIALRYADRKTALLSSLLLCLSSVHIWYSQEARLYSALLFFSLLLVLAYFKIEKTNTYSIWYPVYFCALLAAVFCHYYMLVYLVGIPIICLLGCKNNRPRRAILVFHAVAFALFCLFMLLKVRFGNFHAGLGHLHPFTFFGMLALFFDWFSFGSSLWGMRPYYPAIYCAQIFLLVLLIHGLILNCRAPENRYGRYITLCLLAIPTILLGFTWAGFKHVYIERSTLVILPFFYLTIARGATGFKNKKIARVSVSVLIALSIIGLLGFLTKSDKWTVYKVKPEWRSAARYFNNEARDKTRQLFIFQASSSDVLCYYFKKQGGNPKRLAFEYFIDKDIYRTVSADRIKEFYLIKNRYWYGKYFNEKLQVMLEDPRFRLLDKQSFKGLEIYKFEVTPAAD